MDTTRASSVASARKYLLLLPPCKPVTHADVKTVYGKSVTEVLEYLAKLQEDGSGALLLDIAVACPHLVTAGQMVWENVYAETQRLVAAVYKLVCTIASSKNINIEDSQGIDVRVLLVGWSTDLVSDNTHHHNSTPPKSLIWSLGQLAQSKRPWAVAFGDESKQGEALLRAFTDARAQDHSNCHCRAAKLATQSSEPSDPSRQGTGSPTRRHNAVFRKVAVGGTFDHLHLGHKLLLTMTAFAVDDNNSNSQADQRTIIVGITGDELLKSKKHADFLQSWHDRQEAAAAFLLSLMSSESNEDIPTKEVSAPASDGCVVQYSFPDGLTIQCVKISDPYGPTVTDPAVDGLVLSAETRAGGKSINEKRVDKGWKPLQILEVDVLDADDAIAQQQDSFKSKLSSTAIREKLSRQTASSR